MLMDRLGIEEFQRRRLRVGNAANFQGDERHVMFISVVADSASYAAVRTPDKQRINVAASRAQDQLWVFYAMRFGSGVAVVLGAVLFIYYWAACPNRPA